MTAAPPDPLKQILVAYQSGNLVEADRLCHAVMAESGGPTDALYLDALHLLAAVQFAAGRLAEALASYDGVLALRPDFADALNNRASVLRALKRFEEALAGYDQAIAVRPDFVEALNNRGIVLMALGRFEEALTSYDNALAIQPDYANGLNNRGSALRALNRFEEALASYDKALAIKPDFVAASHNRNAVLTQIEGCKQVAPVEAPASEPTVRPAGPPEEVAGLYTQGNLLAAEGRFAEALSSFDSVVALQADHADALHRRGRVLMELNRYKEALTSCETAIASRPDFAEAFNERGIVLTELRRFPDALASFEKAQKLKPQLADAHWNEARLHLLNGNYSRGWAKFDWQWKRAAPSRKFFQPLWDGLVSLYGKTILLHEDRIHSDPIQFCRYIPLVVARGAKVIVQVQEPLRELIGTVASDARVLSADDVDNAPFDLHCPFAGLPRAFATKADTIPPPLALNVPMDSWMKWEKQLRTRQRRRIGITWAGNAQYEGDRRRSTELRTLLPLLECDATFVTVQKELSADDELVRKGKDEILHFGQMLNDYSQTAALISCLDLVISVDTSVAHLAGALAKPVWVLLPFTPDWRWLLDRTNSPWYPTARLFRQTKHDDWTDVVKSVAGELQAFTQPSSGSGTPNVVSGLDRRPR